VRSVGLRLREMRRRRDLGQRELALGSLKMAITLGYSPREVRNEPELVSLRADPRFAPLLSSAKP